MKNLLQNPRSSFLIAILLLFAGMLNSQPFFTLTNQTQCYSMGSNTAIAYANVIPPGTNSFSWNIVAPGSASACAASVTSFTSMNAGIYIAYPCCGIYSITCTAYDVNNVALTSSTQTASIICTTSLNVSATSSGSVCAGDTITLSTFGASTFTWSNGVIGPMMVATPSANTCYSVVGTTSSGCMASGFACVTVLPWPNLNVTGPTTICKGSSADLIGSGSAGSYTWEPITTVASSINVSPPSTTTYTLYGTSSAGCVGYLPYTLTVDSACSDVWPGDANSDGVVNASDILELGLAFSNTGPARVPGGNAFISQYATNWTGLVSTGKNKCHADCNGDGTVDNNDTVAIHYNFSLTHSFKPSSSLAVADISLDFGSSYVSEGVWSKADIMLGSSSNQVSQLYGVVFDINFDQSVIEPNSAYIVYSPSFLNASNQNIQFRKNDFTNGKIYGASVRVNGTNVSGNGKIGEFWFKVKTGLPNNTLFSASITHCGKIDNNGNDAALNGGSDSVIVLKGVGIAELNNSNNFNVFPNPATDNITLLSGVSSAVTYHVYDLTGREIAKGEFIHSTNLDISSFASGAYFVKFDNENGASVKKLIVEKN